MTADPTPPSPPLPGEKPSRQQQVLTWLPAALGVVGAILIILWLLAPAPNPLSARVPGADRAPGSEGGATNNAVLSGKLIRGAGEGSNLPGSWPGFRGPNRAGFATESAALARTWDNAGPRELWSAEVGEGYAGVAVGQGRVYLVDYDREKKQDAIRCLSLADGKEIWRFSYPVAVKRNHGMSRTVPALAERHVVTLGPKCHVACLDAATGELRWGMDLVRQFGATVPPWYAGQCPLIDNGLVILAPGGDEALLTAVELGTGKVVWQTPNPPGWKMTHSSIMPMEFAGERSYVYCASGGVVGVSARDGRLLWQTADWKISIATVPSPVILEDGRIFLSGGYNAGSLMLQAAGDAQTVTVKTLFRLDPEVFGATQQTPVYYGQHLYGVRPDGQFVCLTSEGKILWQSGSSHTFGLGSFLISQGLLYAVNDSGRLTLAEIDATRFNPLAQAQVLHGREAWAPMALAGTRLILRDLTRMVCLEVGGR